MCLFVRGYYGRKNGVVVLRRKLTSGLFYILENSGLTNCLNPLSWASLSLCETGNRDPGWLDSNETRFYRLDVPCAKCQNRVTYKSGITCANYGHPRGTWTVCRNAYCADCFVSHDLDNFEAAVPRDFNGASLAEIEDEV